MGEVFLVERRGQRLVLKRPLPHLANDPLIRDSLRREAAVLARLKHTCIPRLIDAGVIDDVPYVCTEFVEGLSAASLLSTSATLPPGIALRIAADLAQALHHAHRAVASDGSALNLVHRDVSPANIIVGKDGIARVIDFGIAKTEFTEQTTTGRIKGKFRYMSPEQLAGELVDARSDIFSAGVVLYELLTRTPPFDAKSELALLNAIAHSTPLKPSEHGAPLVLDAIVLRALEKAPERRYASAAQFEAALLEQLLALGTGNDHRAVAAYLAAQISTDPVLPSQSAEPAATRPSTSETKGFSVRGTTYGIDRVGRVLVQLDTKPPDVAHLNRFFDLLDALVSSTEGDVGTLWVISPARHQKASLSGEARARLVQRIRKTPLRVTKIAVVLETPGFIRIAVKPLIVLLAKFASGRRDYRIFDTVEQASEWMVQSLHDGPPAAELVAAVATLRAEIRKA
ncbi:MAG: serine/threonine protein kinase [Deltaproteobacteria bacterium]|nr:serine/threonine protein kinase [Deltaproteobacteria bacterium]